MRTSPEPATGETAARPTARRRRAGYLAQRQRTGMWFTLPVALLVGLLVVLPIGQAVYYSMTTWNGISSTWVGPGTYIQLLESPDFWRVLLNNAMLLVAVPFAIGIPLFVSFLLDQQIAGWRLFRSAYFLPTALSWVVIGMVSVQFFSGGILDGILRATLFRSIDANMLNAPLSALVAVTLTFMWSVFGTNIVIFTAGMATLDREVFEAARVDGAGTWAVWRFATVPQLRRFMQFAFITTLITAFTALFSLIFVMTGGGPGYGTTTLEFFIYQQAFSVGNFGLGATLGVVLVVLMLSVTMVQIRLLLRSD